MPVLNGLPGQRVRPQKSGPPERPEITGLFGPDGSGIRAGPPPGASHHATSPSATLLLLLLLRICMHGCKHRATDRAAAVAHQARACMGPMHAGCCCCSVGQTAACAESATSWKSRSARHAHNKQCMHACLKCGRMQCACKKTSAGRSGQERNKLLHLQ